MNEKIMDIDYSAFSDEIIKLLEGVKVISFATCSDNKVTARTMAIVNDGLNIFFQTSGLSEKMRQVKANPNVAFAVDNIQIEAAARITEDADELAFFAEKYKSKFPQYGIYSGMHNEVVVVCEPTRFALYKYIDGKTCADILDVKAKRAYREVLI